MCLISFQWQPLSDQPLMMVANRDEFHERPSTQSHWWPEHPHVLAGKDLEAGGTWMGVTKSGYFAALTNVRQLPSHRQGQISRGHLVKDYLIAQEDPQTYAEGIADQAHLYDGFNLIIGNQRQCIFISNRNQHTQPLALHAGIYGLSNASLDTPWPKTLYAKKQLEMHAQGQNMTMPLLNRRQTYPQVEQPDTGIGQPWETLLSAPFIVSPSYGTRASSMLTIKQNHVEWIEQSFDHTGSLNHEVRESFYIKSI
ncbi:NRDE family protein [Bermanella marisrubri]|nr:NRDE family protein [Bermanella marisrubri]